MNTDNSERSAVVDDKAKVRYELKLETKTPDSRHWFPPHLSLNLDGKQPPGIITGPWLIKNDEWYKPSWYFEGNQIVEVSEKDDPTFGGRYWFPASAENMHKLSKLNTTSEAQREEMDWWLAWHEWMLTNASVKSLTLKMTAFQRDPSDEDSVHKMIGMTRRVETEKPVNLSLIQRMQYIQRGETPPTTEVVKSTETVPFKHALRFNEYTYYDLYSQQLNAAWYMTTALRTFIQMDMRTGKTASAIVAMLDLMEHNEIDKGIVVCPTSNIYDPWITELEAHGVRFIVMDGTKDDDFEALKRNDWDVVLLNYERVGSRIKEMLYRVEGFDPQRVMVVADETSFIKNPYSNRSKDLRQLCWICRYVTLLNGTPMQQGPQDLWAQYNCIDPYGLILGNPFNEYIRRWLTKAKSTFKVPPMLRTDFEAMLSSTAIRYIRGEADQFTGKDKTFRYIQLPCTESQMSDIKDVTEGYITKQDDEGDEERVNIGTGVLSLYLHMREICNGYNKYPLQTEDEAVERGLKSREYARVSYDVDPKIMWLRTYIEANPTQPLVIFTEFVEQGQHIKEMLNELGLKWASTRPFMAKTKVKHLNPAISIECYNFINEEFFYGQGVPGTFVMPGFPVKIPSWITHNERVVSTVDEAGFRDDVTYFDKYLDKGTYKGQDRKDQIDRFQYGEADYFILDPRQGYGLSLHRKPAWSNGIGIKPAMVFMCPVWSLGNYEQSQDRCVTTDEETGKTTNTLIYALSIKGSIEDHVLEALRLKKDVQSTLLQDTTREGFNTFVHNLVEAMEDARNDPQAYFDADEMRARALLGVSPISKLSKGVILRGIKTKHGYTRKAAMDWLKGEAEQKYKDAYQYLNNKMNETTK